MSWVWLGLLVLAGAALWLRRRLAAQREAVVDAVLQESLDPNGPHAQTKVPPAKQPWTRPGFGPPAVPDTLDFGDRPLPPAAGELEDPSVAGPLPDDDDVPVAIDMSPVEEPPPARVKPPPPPPPGAASATEASSAETPETAPSAPADAPADAPAEASDVPALVLEVDDEIDMLAAIRGPQVLELPPDVADEARELMRSRQEVAAVRLVCDSMGVGILDAQRTVRALVGR